MIELLIVAAIIVFIALYKSPARVNHSIVRLQKKVLPYSGVDKENFIKYVNLLQLMEMSIGDDIDIAAGFFYTAIHCLDQIHSELAERQVEIGDLVREIQSEGETLLLNQALKNKQFFIPRYINEFEYNYTLGETH